MTTSATDKPRHVHYCKDFRDATLCFDRGYCECECGARAACTIEEGTYEAKWKEPLDLMAALKSSLAGAKEPTS